LSVVFEIVRLERRERRTDRHAITSNTALA